MDKEIHLLTKQEKKKDKIAERNKPTNNILIPTQTRPLFILPQSQWALLSSDVEF